MDPVARPSVLQRLASEVIDPTGVAGGIVGPIGFELRQISGLTAGAAHPIASGGIIYTSEDNVDGFRLDADADGAIVLTPLDLPVRLDNRLIDGPRHVDDALIDVGFAGFRVASRRLSRVHQPGVAAPLDRILERRPPTGGEVVVPNRGIEQRELIRLVNLEYESALRKARTMWPGPEEIMFNIFEQGPLVWSQTSADPAFGHVAVALGSLPWQLQLSQPVEMSSATYAEIKRHQSLPAVPIVADLGAGPLGLAGPREMTLAIARQVILNRAVLSSPRSLAVGILANRETVGDWAWMRPLPHLDRLEGNRKPLRILDDLDSLHSAAEVVIVDHAEQLPEHCALSVIVGDDARCTVIDGESDQVTMAATPLGLHPRLTEGAVHRLARLFETHSDVGVEKRSAEVAEAAAIPVTRSPIDVAPVGMGYESSFF